MPGRPMLSGHQPSFHHPGILAKRLRIDRRAAAAGTDCTWLVADQDINEPGLIGFPDLDGHSGANLNRLPFGVAILACDGDALVVIVPGEWDRIEWCVTDRDQYVLDKAQFRFRQSSNFLFERCDTGLPRIGAHIGKFRP